MKPTQIVENALAIAREYQRDHDMKLTLRQMYYQFVARALISNGPRSYKRIGAALTVARYSGMFPVDALEDRGRTVHPSKNKANQVNVEGALANVADELRTAPQDWLYRDRWFGQPVHVSVWVEKEALLGVFEPPCKALGVSWFACKGYPSVSALNDWLTHVVDALDDGAAQRAVVLYFGDHDPDGFEIPRSAERNIGKLQTIRGWRWAKDQAEAYGWSEGDEGYATEVDARVEDYTRARISFERVALTLEQVREYNPPPFPAKPTSSRFDKYVAEHGIQDAWELDALNPNVLRDLIVENVGRHFDQGIHEANGVRVAIARKDMHSRMEAADVYNVLKRA